MYYLIEHNRTSKQTECTEYSDYTHVQIAGLKKEQLYLQDQRHEMEVVVFEASSLDDLKRTHSRYFVAEQKNTNDGTGALLAVGLVGLAIYLLTKK
ncbi:hypothetical protein CBF23_011185 [Marinomonas agarivorans]|nr:hypothetical protein CBF23_011185 [Marinomonas agarivorans]